MTNEEIRKYAREKRNALSFFNTGVEDYISARCLLRNGLLTGLVLASQAVEKILKSYLYLKDEPKINTHKPHKLVDKVQSLYGLNLDNYRSLAEKLYYHYQTRYPDNTDQSSEMSTGELDEIDDLVIYLIEHFPVPEDIKIRIGLFSRLFRYQDNRVDFKSSAESFWIMKDNLALKPKIQQMRDEFKKVRETVPGT